MDIIAREYIRRVNYETRKYPFSESKFVNAFKAFTSKYDVSPSVFFHHVVKKNSILRGC